MKRLWAPWRVEYIESKKSTECIFCATDNKKMPEGELLLYAGKLASVMLNKYPYNSGHLLIAPSRHLSKLDSITDEEFSEVSKLLKHSTAVLEEEYSPEGFNIGMNIGKAAGAGIEDHLHWHIVPRWNGDTNYMPVTSEVRVIPEHLNRTAERLRPHFKSID